MNAPSESWLTALHQMAQSDGTGGTGQHGNMTERYLVIAFHLCAGGGVSAFWLRNTFNLSHATAKRDMQKIQLLLPVEQEKLAVNPASSALHTVVRLRRRLLKLAA